MLTNQSSTLVSSHESQSAFLCVRGRETKRPFKQKYASGSDVVAFDVFEMHMFANLCSNRESMESVPSIHTSPWPKYSHFTDKLYNRVNRVREVWPLLLGESPQQ